MNQPIDPPSWMDETVFREVMERRVKNEQHRRKVESEAEARRLQQAENERWTKQMQSEYGPAAQALADTMLGEIVGFLKAKRIDPTPVWQTWDVPDSTVYRHEAPAFVGWQLWLGYENRTYVPFVDTNGGVWHAREKISFGAAYYCEARLAWDVNRLIGSHPGTTCEERVLPSWQAGDILAKPHCTECAPGNPWLDRKAASHIRSATPPPPSHAGLLAVVLASQSVYPWRLFE
jgi:hypothetical protein